MKTKISIFTIAVMSIATTVFVGCNGEDLSTPVIVVDGDNPLNIELGTPWTMPGYTATDDEDGDITASVSVDDSQVNTSAIDTYEVTLTVSDGAGNTAIETLVVNVTMGKTPYTGIYTVHEECDMDEDGNFGEVGEVFDYSVTINAGGGEDELVFSNFGGYGDAVVAVVTFSGDLNEVLNVDYDLAGTGIHFSGDGLVTIGTTSDIEFTLDYQAEDGGTIVPCNAVYTKL